MNEVWLVSHSFCYTLKLDLLVCVCLLWCVLLFSSLKHEFSLFYSSVLLHSSYSSSSSSLRKLGFAPVLLSVRITASAFILVTVRPKLNDLTANKHNIQRLASQSHYRSFSLQLDTTKTQDVTFQACLVQMSFLMVDCTKKTHFSWLVSLFEQQSEMILDETWQIAVHTYSTCK